MLCYWVAAKKFKSSYHSPDTIYLDPPQYSIKGLMVSIRWYLGCLKGYLGGAGRLLYMSLSYMVVQIKSIE